jgi:hypothetical protein
MRSVSPVENRENHLTTCAPRLRERADAEGLDHTTHSGTAKPKGLAEAERRADAAEGLDHSTLHYSGIAKPRELVKNVQML